MIDLDKLQKKIDALFEGETKETLTRWLKEHRPIEYCTCGNPSGEGSVKFEDEEKLIYYCADCGKQVLRV